MIGRRWLLAIGVALPTALRAQVCDSGASGQGASRDLYCMTLVPVPGLDTVSARVELGRIPGPFTVTVTDDARPVYAPFVTITGLPAPEQLGRYSTYVAWVASPTLYPERRLGVVHNGRTVLPPIDLDPFLILVTAESSATVQQPTGRMVLRGGSPSSRLVPPDLLQFTVGSTPTGASHHHAHAMANMPDMARTTAANDSGVQWTTVPMIPGIPMLPAEMVLRPSTSPYLPTSDRPLPFVRPTTTVQLRSGDTLHLTAGLVRDTVAGRPAVTYAFNGEHPGPTIAVPQGSEIVVDYTNDLDQPSAVHWHGLRLDNASDGAPGVTQDAVPSGGHFVYHLRFPDAGIYWYHPHVREDMQQNLGLYGNLLVRSPRADFYGSANQEQRLILSDLLVGSHGLVPYGRTAATHAFMGRFGNVFLVNGRSHYALHVRRGEVVRFLLTNASNSRTYNLSFPGASMKLIGSDGSPYEREIPVRTVVIAPAERYVVAVRFPKPGRIVLVSRIRELDHLFGRFMPHSDTLGVVLVSADPAHPDLAASFASPRVDSAVVADISRFRPYFDRPPDRTLILALATQDLPFATRQLMQLDSAYFAPIEWSGTMPAMNWASTSDQVHWVLRDAETGREDTAIGWHFHRGDVIKLRLINERRALHGMQHPIHLHGQRFLVLAVNGVPNDDLAWKDTVLVPAGGMVDILVDLSNPGRWMLHCHIAEHLGSGMMTVFTVD